MESGKFVVPRLRGSGTAEGGTTNNGRPTAKHTKYAKGNNLEDILLAYFACFAVANLRSIFQLPNFTL